MAKFWMSLLWGRCLGPLTERFGHFRRSELTTNGLLSKGSCGFLSSLPHSVHAYSFALIQGCHWHLSEWLCLTKLGNKTQKNSRGANLALT